MVQTTQLGSAPRSHRGGQRFDSAMLHQKEGSLIRRLPFSFPIPEEFDGMKCLERYAWVKLPRTQIPAGRSLLSNFMRLYASAAYRPGQARYCQYINEVHFGQWVGGIVGLKSILGLSSREQAFLVLEELSNWGLLEYEYDPKSKRLSYHISQTQRIAVPTQGIPIYAREQGFLCVPRTLTQPLIQAGYVFEEIDAWLDLWIHTIYRDSDSPLSNIVPLVQFDTGPALTLASLGNRWGWERTKVWRFFKKYADTFFLFKLPGSYGAVVCNMMYCQTENAHSVRKTISRFVCKILILGRNTLSGQKTYLRLNRLLRLFGAVVGKMFFWLKSRVAPRSLYTRAYISSWIDLSGLLDCKRVFGGTSSVRDPIMIRGE